MDGAWIGNITGTQWSGNKLSGTFTAFSLGDDCITNVQGELIGIYDNSNRWQSVGAGIWNEEPLTFSGKIGYEASSLYYNNSGSLSYIGEDYGYIDRFSLGHDSTG